MSVTVASVKELFPELAAIADATVQRWLSFAEAKHNAAAFGVKSDYALKCLAAHLVELDKRRQAGATGSVAVVSSRTVGDVSTTYAVPASSSTADAALGSTLYGQMYLDLRSSIFPDRVI